MTRIATVWVRPSGTGTRHGWSFNVPLPRPFDNHYMVELFKLGYALGSKGYRWSKIPPGYADGSLP